MDFPEWFKDYKKVFAYCELQNIKEQKIKLGSNTMIIPNIHTDAVLQLYNAYKIHETNRRLVKATWVLAIGTLILSGLTLYLTFFTGAT